VLSFQGLADLENKEWFEQLPFIVAVSVAAGLLGAMFNKAHKWIFKASLSRHTSFQHPQCTIVRQYSLHILKTIKSLQRIIVHSQWRAPRANNTARLLEAVGLGLFTIAAIFFLSYTFGECVDVPAWHEQVWYIYRPVKMHMPLKFKV
jgi:hypothetical protein